MIAVYFFQTHCIDYKYWQGEGSRQGAVPPPQKFFFKQDQQCQFFVHHLDPPLNTGTYLWIIIVSVKRSCVEFSMYVVTCLCAVGLQCAAAVDACCTTCMLCAGLRKGYLARLTFGPANSHRSGM